MHQLVCSYLVFVFGACQYGNTWTMLPSNLQDHALAMLNDELAA